MYLTHRLQFLSLLLGWVTKWMAEVVIEKSNSWDWNLGSHNFNQN